MAKWLLLVVFFPSLALADGSLPGDETVEVNKIPDRGTLRVSLTTSSRGGCSQGGYTETDDLNLELNLDAERATLKASGHHVSDSYSFRNNKVEHNRGSKQAVDKSYVAAKAQRKGKKLVVELEKGVSLECGVEKVNNLNALVCRPKFSDEGRQQLVLGVVNFPSVMAFGYGRGFSQVADSEHGVPRSISISKKGVAQ